MAVAEGPVLDGKVVVVSGCGSGLGRCVATAALRDGARVFLGARTAETLRVISEELDPSGERVGWRNVDITDAERCAKFASAAAERFGRVDALVNVAALDSDFGGLMNSEPADWSRLTSEATVAVTGFGG